MRHVSVKSANDIRLLGIAVELDIVGDEVTAIMFSDVEGNQVRVAKRDWSSIRIEVPAPPKVKDVWRLSGTVLGLPVAEDFDTEQAANDARRRYDDRVVSDSALEVGKVAVTVADDSVSMPGDLDDTPF